MKKLTILKKPMVIVTLIALIVLLLETFVAIKMDDDFTHIIIYSALFSIVYFLILLFATLKSKKIELLLVINVLSVFIYNNIIFLVGLDADVIQIPIALYIVFIIMTLFIVTKTINNKFLLISMHIIHLIARVAITYLLLWGWALSSMGV